MDGESTRARIPAWVVIVTMMLLGATFLLYDLWPVIRRTHRIETFMKIARPGRAWSDAARDLASARIVLPKTPDIAPWHRLYDLPERTPATVKLIERHAKLLHQLLPDRVQLLISVDTTGTILQATPVIEQRS